MKDILTAPWMLEMIRTVTNMYDHGWDERNGGNVSLLLEEGKVADYVDGAVLRVDFQPCGVAHHVGGKLGGKAPAVREAPEKLRRFAAVC